MWMLGIEPCPLEKQTVCLTFESLIQSLLFFLKKVIYGVCVCVPQNSMWVEARGQLAGIHS